LRNQAYLDDYTRFWLRGHEGSPQPHFHKFSSWFADAVQERYLVNHDREFIIGLLDDLVADYRQWESERQQTNGLFWQYDVRDAMEESISGSRYVRNVRPTINSYMVANARAIVTIADLAGKPGISKEFNAKASTLLQLTQNQLWNQESEFFEVVHPDGRFADVREAIGFIPWMFNLPEPGKGYENAWKLLTDPRGFAAPYGITTAERRHPEFRSHGIGTCEWDGALWPFATSQTLYGLANLLRHHKQSVVSPADYYDAFLTYTQSQRADGKPYIGEYQDEVTGDWINGRGGRSRYYNHSVFADLLITGVIGLIPRADNIVEVSPLLPAGTWNWFCLDGIRYHDHMLTVIWDKDGSRYQRGVGMMVLADGNVIARSGQFQRVTGKLP